MAAVQNYFLFQESVQLSEDSGFPGGSVVKNLPATQETRVQSLSQEDSPEEGNGNPLQYGFRNPYCL